MDGRLIGIDHGIRRIGIAVSDPSGLIARELAIIIRKSKHEDFERINNMASEHKAVAFVVGLPLNPDANPNTHTQADTVRLWAQRFGETTDLPITLWDEQLSSVDARGLAKMQKRKPDAPIDDLAARVILQSYLDAVRDGLVDP